MSCKDSREMWMKQKDEPIRVAQIMGKLWAGGVEMVVFNYYRAIDKSKIQFDFYYDADSTVEPPQNLIDMGARFYKIPPYQKLPQYIRELKKHLKENQYLIVHSHLNTLSVFPLFVAWMCRVPVRVAHNHSVPSGKELKRDALKYFLRIFGRVFPTDYFACSEKAGRWMFGNRNYDAGKVVVIKNATDFERFRVGEEIIEKLKKQLGLNDKFVIGHIGRFTFAKNHEFLLDVFKKIHKLYNPTFIKNREINCAHVEELKQKYGKFVLMVSRFEYPHKDQYTVAKMLDIVRKKYHEDLDLVFVGDGPDEESVKKYVITLSQDTQEHIHFEGSRFDVQDYYKAAFLLVHASVAGEGLPTIMIEAMSYRLPMVVTDSKTGPREILGENEYGLLCRVKDPEDMANKVKKIASDPDLYNHYVLKSDERIKDFSPDVIKERLKSILEEVEEN